MWNSFVGNGHGKSVMLLCSLYQRFISREQIPIVWCSCTQNDSSWNQVLTAQMFVLSLSTLRQKFDYLQRVYLHVLYYCWCWQYSGVDRRWFKRHLDKNDVRNARTCKKLVTSELFTCSTFLELVSLTSLKKSTIKVRFFASRRQQSLQILKRFKTF